jgi:hypothetical protein
MKDADLTYEIDPNEGSVGLLTVAEFDRFTRAITNARKHVAWWRIAGHIKSGDDDELRARSNEPTIPLYATWLAAEEITNLLQEINHWDTPKDVAKFGHEFALLLTREVEIAEDKPHKVRFLRCRACQQMTLKYYPPRAGGADITVKCTNCRAVEDPMNFAIDAALIAEENEIAKRRVGSSKRRTRKSGSVDQNGLQVGGRGPSEVDAPEAAALVVSS